MKLIIDCREKKLISLFEQKSVSISIESLPLGDICIRTDEGALIALFERKTIQDLLSSISDGRYEEQSFRLQQCGLDKRKIFYIIEGNIEQYVGKGQGLYSKNTVHSCMYSLTFIKGFSLICSNSVSHTSDIIDKFFKKIESDPSAGSYGSHQYIDSVKLTKKGNLSDEMVTIMMLAQIPKVSKNAAEAVMKNYDYSIPTIVKALSDNSSCLNEIVLSIANNKTRKLSKPCIENIKKYMLSIDK